MSELSYNQKRDIVERLQEALAYDPERRYPTDTASEIVDSWLPIYYHQIVETWVEAGSPDPDETMPEQLERDKRQIHYLMTLGLWEVARDFASGAIWSNETGEANTHAEALENLTENYPEFIKQPA
jgi:hypothetical protein